MFWEFNFFTKLERIEWSIKESLSPDIIIPDAGQGARKLKSYFPAGGPINKDKVSVDFIGKKGVKNTGKCRSKRLSRNIRNKKKCKGN